MAIKRKYKKKFKGVVVKSGHIYSFKYQAWENDPRPTVIMMYALDGVNPNTGHQWRFFQGINFTYIPRGDRKRFAKDWMRIMGGRREPKFTWQTVMRKYPYLKHAVRRYFFKPNYYIRDLTEIPWSDAEKAIVSTFAKDFSKKVKTSLIAKFRRVIRGRKKAKKTGKYPKRR